MSEMRPVRYNAAERSRLVERAVGNEKLADRMKGSASAFDQALDMRDAADISDMVPRRAFPDYGRAFGADQTDHGPAR